MKIGIPKESLAGENRVAATPKTVPELKKLGYDVVIEDDAGLRADLPDMAFTAAGAQVVSSDEVWASDIVVMVNEPTPDELKKMKPGSTLVGFLHPRFTPEVADTYAKAGITAISMDMVPRISRAQSMDALSSMANISGYRAVAEAMNRFGRFFGGQVTAAGKVPPAEVFVIGTGVAGLSAIGTANSLGAIVRATDVRPETAEQVESMGASFVHVEDPNVGQDVSSDGYAKETTEDFNKLAAKMYTEQLKKADVVICTAAIPGRPSPKLLTKEMVEGMKHGSVIVDLAATGGGNCELTVPGDVIKTDNQVTIIGYTDWASRLPGQSSQLYGTNVVNLFKLLTPEKDGNLTLDFDDEIIRQVTVSRSGEVTYPPPPVQVAAAPVAKPAAPPAEVAEPEPKAPANPAKQAALIGVAAVALIALLSFTGSAFLDLMAIFVLAIVAGYYVVWNVTHALHTPLMSVTNAISGVIIVGAMLQLVIHKPMADFGWVDWTILVLAGIAVLIASINIFGGFTVTARMLTMFQKGK